MRTAESVSGWRRYTVPYMTVTLKLEVKHSVHKAVIEHFVVPGCIPQAAVSGVHRGAAAAKNL